MLSFTVRVSTQGADAVAADILYEFSGEVLARREKEIWRSFGKEWRVPRMIMFGMSLAMWMG